MKFQQLKNAVNAGLLSLLIGCSSNLKLTSLRAGYGFRRARGNWIIYHKEKNIPFVRTQANFELDKNLELWTRADYTKGDVEFNQYLAKINVIGNMESLSIGASYFPFNKRLSFDFGGELFYADVPSIRGNLGFVRNEIGTPVFGWGGNLGLTYEQPIKHNVFFFVSGGYNFTDNVASQARFELDGWYGFVGIGVKLK